MSSGDNKPKSLAKKKKNADFEVPEYLSCCCSCCFVCFLFSFVLFFWNLPISASKWSVHSNTKNAKSRVHQFQVCYFRTTDSSTRKCYLVLICEPAEHAARGEQLIILQPINSSIPIHKMPRCLCQGHTNDNEDVSHMCCKWNKGYWYSKGQ